MPFIGALMAVAFYELGYKNAAMMMYVEEQEDVIGD